MPPKTSHRKKPAEKAKSPKRRELVLLDTGPLVGLYNEKDDWHDRCEKFFGQEDRFDYLLTHAVLCEVVFHIQKGKHSESASQAVINLLELIENDRLILHKYDDSYITRMKKLRLKYKDKKLDIADLSLVLAAEDCQIEKIVTIDQKDFGFLTFRRIGKSAKQSAFTIVLPDVNSPKD